MKNYVNHAVSQSLVYICLNRHFQYQLKLLRESKLQIHIGIIILARYKKIVLWFRELATWRSYIDW